MKLIFTIIFSVLPTLTHASVFPIMPSLATESMPAEQVLVTCLLENQDADYTEFNINKDGDMVATLNPKYWDMGLGNYIKYMGLDVQTLEDVVLVRAVLMTMAGEVEVDLNLERKIENNVVLAGQKAVCKITTNNSI